MSWRENLLLGVLAVLAVLAPLAESAAFELLSADTSRDGPAYRLEIEAVFLATPAQLLAVLTDYDRIHKLHPDMIESRSLGRVGPGMQEVYTRFDGCVLMFCRTLHRVERIQQRGTSLYAEDVPGRGSFSEGATEWHFTATADGTRLRYETRFIPAFRVAPVFGAALLASSIERMTLETMAEVDRRAVLHDD